ncbi:MAG: hypothetical protein ACOX9C_07185 [Kiritimatiellia bacterium]|jgi:hypothetical protein
MTTTRGVVHVLLTIAILVAIPFVIEMLLNTYEVNRNPWTKPGAIVADGGPVHAGVNRRQFKEIRFRSTGMRMYFKATNLPQEAADRIEDDVTGRLRVLQDDEEVLAYDFCLAPGLKRNLGGLHTQETQEALSLIEIVRKYDVECAIKPKDSDDVAAAERLNRWEFAVGETVELAFDFKGRIPETAGLVFSYSKCPSSLLHGTFLERFAKRLTRKNPG